MLLQSNRFLVLEGFGGWGLSLERTFGESNNNIKSRTSEQSDRLV